MKHLLALAVLLSLLASAAPAQSSCSVPGVDISVNPPNAAPGELIDVTLTNNTGAVFELLSTCVFEGVYAGTDCTSGEAIGGLACGDAITPIAPGASLTSTWNQLDFGAQQVADGTYSFRIFISGVVPNILTCCAFVTIDGSPGTSSCSGDGGDQMGCTDCPCSNNAPQGTVGGCLNSAGTSTRLIGSGSTSIAAANLRFEATGLPPVASSILTSGNSLAPANPANPCFGLDSGIQAVALNGLRCAVQGVLRHGGRFSDLNGDIGVTNNGWGDPNGFFQFNVFTAGDTKHFQIIHRDITDGSCPSTQNSSQAVSVTFTP